MLARRTGADVAVSKLFCGRTRMHITFKWMRNGNAEEKRWSSTSQRSSSSSILSWHLMLFRSGTLAVLLVVIT